MRDTSTPFLIRPRPQPGESLSSWRQRAGWANGYSLFPVLDERTRRSDPDLGVSLHDLNWIARLHGATLDQVMSMTLRSLLGKVIHSLTPRCQPPWWLRSRMAAAGDTNGPMFCPDCLATDAVPHFRLRWRLGFVTHCETHRTRLLDRCPRCGCAPWPSGCGRHDAVHEGFQSLRNCWHCGFEYESTVDNPEPVVLADDPASWLDISFVQLGEVSVPSIEAFQALRAVGQIFLRNLPANNIKATNTVWSEALSNLSRSASRSRAFELLCVADRAVLVPAAHQILSRWPSSFLSFCKEADITRVHFDGTSQLQPPWMTAVIDAELARQNRFVTRDVLASTIADLRTRKGKEPTITEIRAQLCWKGSKGLGEFYPTKRAQATQDEWLSFLGACTQSMDRTAHEPLRSRLPASFALVAVLLELLRAHGLACNQRWTRMDMVHVLGEARLHCILDGTLFAAVVDSLLLTLRNDLTRSTRVLMSETQSCRQTAKRFRSLTSSLPADLDRSPCVFLAPARADGLTQQMHGPLRALSGAKYFDRGIA
ncbi:TniQ family protein [Hydrogenophaga sp. RWCD_12]|uniref:TniQ family protein n=1 Tax=Hydrogenophaga sp. RWCD_12 TaxID=3391190 RepID=UPI003984F4E9